MHRIEDGPLLAGRGRFIANLVPDDALHVAFVRSTEPHALVTSIDTTACLIAEGVVAALSFDDLVGVSPIVPYHTVTDPAFVRPLLAAGRVRFVGEPIIAVVATSAAAAADACELVSIEYAALPFVVEPDVARHSEVLLFPEAGTNVACSITDPPIDFSECEVVVSADIVNPRMYSAPMEGRSALAVWNDPRVECYSATQGVYLARGKIATAIGAPPELVRVVTPDVGGAFGAKSTPGVEECLVAYLARMLRRSMAWVETRTESLLSLGHCRGQRQRVTMGGTRAGRITHYRFEVTAELGAFPDVNALLPVFTRLMTQGAYDIANVEYRSEGIVTNTTPVGSFRGAGRPEATAAVERAVDLFAAAAELDPAEVRRANFVRADHFPFTTRTGATYDCGDYPLLLSMALDAAGYDSLRAEQARRRAAGDRLQLGIGLCSYVEVTAQGGAGLGVPEFGELTLLADGTMALRVGSTAAGQGHVTTWASLAAKRLGVGVSEVEVIHADTDRLANASLTAGSRSVQIIGPSITGMADQLIAKAREVAADLLEAASDDVTFEPSMGFFVLGTPARTVSWVEVAQKGALHVTNSYAHTAPSYPYGTHVAVVEVDTETGGVTLQRLIAADDAGVLLQPELAHGQIHGGIASGVGPALTEGVVYDRNGALLTSNFADYGVISAAELPSYEVIVNELPTPLNPLGAKGAGESGTVGAGPAVQNAIVDALAHLGVRHIDMPCTPERVWQALCKR